MTRRRFFSPLDSFAADRTIVRLHDDEARHLRDVLRLRTGDEVYVFDGAGREFRCVIAEVKRDGAQLNIISEVGPMRPESPVQITLAVALLKGDKFDLVVQKTTELGVNGIVPLVTAQADIKLRDEADSRKKVARWQRIAIEAAKQSGRAVVPEIHAPAGFKEFIRRDEGIPRFLFSERDGGSLLDTKQEIGESLIAVVGPEGGWSDEELSLARETDWRIVTLGGRTLRAETAAITVTALLQHIFGDLT